MKKIKKHLYPYLVITFSIITVLFLFEIWWNIFGYQNTVSNEGGLIFWVLLSPLLSLYIYVFYVLILWFIKNYLLLYLISVIIISLQLCWALFVSYLTKIFILSELLQILIYISIVPLLFILLRWIFLIFPIFKNRLY